MSLMPAILLYDRAGASVTLGVMIVWPEVSRIIWVDVATIGAERAAVLMATDVRRGCRTGLSDDPMRRLTRWAGAGSNRRPSAFQAYQSAVPDCRAGRADRVADCPRSPRSTAVGVSAGVILSTRPLRPKAKFRSS